MKKSPSKNVEIERRRDGVREAHGLPRRLHVSSSLRLFSPAFTLIELLVVVTIIVVLLALLVPAMDKAIYQAELAVCGTNLKAVGVGASMYAFDSKRYYPRRSLVMDYQGVEIDSWKLTVASGDPAVPRAYDDRPILRNHIAVGKTLVCPFNAGLDLEVSDQDTYVYSSYGLWFGWRYTTGTATAPGAVQRGMFKLGDSMEYSDVDGTNSFRVLAGDFLSLDTQGYGGISSHFEKGNTWVNMFSQDTEQDWAGGKKATVSWWGGYNSGNIDLNFVMDDNSVQRRNDVRMRRDPVRAEGLKPVRLFLDERQPFRKVYLPEK